MKKQIPAAVAVEKTMASNKKNFKKKFMKVSKQKASIQAMTLPSLNDEYESTSESTHDDIILKNPHPENLLVGSPFPDTTEEKLCINCEKCICRHWSSKSKCSMTRYH